jgi:hypothetical protein
MLALKKMIEEDDIPEAELPALSSMYCTVLSHLTPIPVRKTLSGVHQGQQQFNLGATVSNVAKAMHARQMQMTKGVDADQLNTIIYTTVRDAGWNIGKSTTSVVGSVCPNCVICAQN